MRDVNLNYLEMAADNLKENMKEIKGEAEEKVYLLEKASKLLEDAIEVVKRTNDLGKGE